MNKKSFKILKTENRHANNGEYIAPIGLPSEPPVSKVVASYADPQYLDADEYTQAHEGWGYVDCIGSGKKSRLQYYEYEVITEWEGDIQYASENYIRGWILK